MIVAPVPHVFSHNHIAHGQHNMHKDNYYENKNISMESSFVETEEEMNNKKKKLKEVNEFGHQVLRKIYYLIVTALSLVSALAWNSAFQNFFQHNKFLKHRGPWIYALIISAITIGLIIGFTKLIEKVENKKIKDIKNEII